MVFIDEITKQINVWFNIKYRFCFVIKSLAIKLTYTEKNDTLYQGLKKKEEEEKKR